MLRRASAAVLAVILGCALGVGSALPAGAAIVVDPYDDRVAAFSQVSDWTAVSHTSAFLGKHTRANRLGAQATLTFTGTRVVWRGVKGSSYGRAEVRIDNGTPVLVDTYASSTSYQAAIWTSPVLPDGIHTLSIKVLGKNSKSSNTYISVDRFDVSATVSEVTATVETEPVSHAGDAADDPALWLNPADPAASTVIGTDKLGGIEVYALDGSLVQSLPVGNVNNVDIRSAYSLAGESVSLVTAGNRSDNSLMIFKVDPGTRRLVDVRARQILTGEVYGSCMYRSPVTGKYYYFLNNKSGVVTQWELVEVSDGKVDAVQVRSFDVGTQTEGCVADDENAQFYIGEETVGIWRYGAEPEAGTARIQIDNTGPVGHLTGQVEGLTILYASGGGGYLIAASQTDSTFAVYSRATGAYLRSFRIVDGAATDGTTGTDGIDGTSAALGAAFPHGVFVAQDDSNSGGNQNFKLVPLQSTGLP